MRAWMVANPFGYVLETDSDFNGPYGSVAVSWLIAHPESWVGLGVVECVFTNSAPDARLYNTSMSFEGNKVTYTGEPKSLEEVRTSVQGRISEVRSAAEATQGAASNAVDAALALADTATTAETFEDLAALMAEADGLGA